MRSPLPNEFARQIPSVADRRALIPWSVFIVAALPTMAGALTATSVALTGLPRRSQELKVLAKSIHLIDIIKE